MNFKNFVKKVKEFSEVAEEYMEDVAILYEKKTDFSEDDPGTFHAVLKVIEPYGHKERSMKLIVNHKGKLVIEIDEDILIDATDTGLYIFLWHEAEAQFAQFARLH